MKKKELAMKESDEAREMRESIEEMERELAELDRDIAEAKKGEKGEKGEMSRVALRNFLAMRKDIVEMIASNRALYKAVLESEALEARLESEMKEGNK